MNSTMIYISKNYGEGKKGGKMVHPIHMPVMCTLHVLSIRQKVETKAFILHLKSYFRNINSN